MSTLETKGNRSVSKALRIIETLAESPKAMRLIDIASRVEMPPSTVLRMIATLVDYGYLAQDADSQRYFLTMKFATIGSMVASRFNMRDIVHPYIARIARLYGEATCMAIDDYMTALYVDFVDGPDGMLRIMQHIGKRSPLHCSGVGKCLLLNYDESMLDEFIAQKGLPVLTRHTITTRGDLMEELAITRKRGYALDNEECELGARCVACGIANTAGKVVAAISVSGPVSRMTDDYVEKISASLMEAAAQISRLL